MAESMLVFAPNANSYRRLRPLTYAPTAPTWGWNNRTVALRIPPGGAAARRIEHRVAGSDANPYLVLAAVLAGVLHGLEQRLEPGPPVVGNAYAQSPVTLPLTWEAALAAFRDGERLPRLVRRALLQAVRRRAAQGERDRFHAPDHADRVRVVPDDGVRRLSPGGAGLLAQVGQGGARRDRLGIEDQVEERRPAARPAPPRRPGANSSVVSTRAPKAP